MKPNVFIIHGAYGCPNENWFSWLKNKLDDERIECFVPHFPTPKEQSLENWLQIFDSYRYKISEKSILIGHSLGAVFLLRWLEIWSGVKINKCFLIGGFLGKVNVALFDILNRDFFIHPFNWHNIKMKVDEFILYHGNDDPYVSHEYANSLTASLNATKIVVANAGHFNKASGYKSFPLLWTHLQKVL